jgi:outer membrane protein TolC
MTEATVENFELTAERVAEARAADRIAKGRYQRGVEGLLTVLETERRLRLAEQANITSTADVWNTRIDLFLALGGDWGTDPADPVTPAESQSATADDDRSASADSGTQHSEFNIQNSEEVS